MEIKNHRNQEIDEEIQQIYHWAKKDDVNELAKYFNCNPDEVCTGDYIARISEDEECPYKVIVGFADFSYSHTKEGKLRVIVGRRNPDPSFYNEYTYKSLRTEHSDYLEFKTLKKVYGSVRLDRHTKSTGSIEYIGGSLYLNLTDVAEVPNLKFCGILSVDESKLESLDAIEEVDRFICTLNSSLTSLGSLSKVNKSVELVNCSYNSYLKEFEDLKRVRNLLLEKERYIKFIKKENYGDYKESILIEVENLMKLRRRYNALYQKFEKKYQSSLLVRKLFRTQFTRVKNGGFVQNDTDEFQV